MINEIKNSWSTDAGGYDNQVNGRLADKQEVAHWQNELNSALNNKSNLDILVAGCGPGFLSILLSRLGHHVTAVDSAEGMVKCAKNNFAREGCDISVKLDDVITLAQEKENTYDAVISRDVVWTLYNPEKAYSRWKEILKPGGLVIVYDGNYRRDKKSLITTCWKVLSKVLIIITEGRIPKKPKHHNDDAFKNLPFVTVERPAADETVLRQLGYEIVTITNDSHRNNFKRLSFWKYGYQGKKFKIIARKPKS